MYPKPIQNLIELFSRFPGIGPRQAARFVFHILKEPAEYRKYLADGILQIEGMLLTCTRCGNIEERPLNSAEGKSETPKEIFCAICRDRKRDQKRIAVVESVTDLRALEKSRAYNGIYHVLAGSIVSQKGIVGDTIRVKDLVKRIKDKKPEEIIIATSPTFEGDTTARYVERELRSVSAGGESAFGGKVTRLARGLAKGVDLEYVDEETLREALTGRR